MYKIRVHELAKEINKSSNEIMRFLKTHGKDVPSHMSTLGEETSNMVREHFTQKVLAANTNNKSIKNDVRNNNNVNKVTPKVSSNVVNNTQIVDLEKNNANNHVLNATNINNINSNAANNKNNINSNGVNNINNNGVNNRNNNGVNNINNNGVNNINNNGVNNINNNGVNNKNNINNNGTNNRNNNGANNRNNVNNNGANNRNNVNNNGANNRNNVNNNGANNRNNVNNNAANNRNNINSNGANNRNNINSNTVNNINQKNAGNNQNKNINTINQRSVSENMKNNNAVSNNVNQKKNKTNQNGNNQNMNNGSNKKNNNQSSFGRNNDRNAKPVQTPKIVVEKEKITEIKIPELLTIKELADKMKIQPSAIVKKLFLQGKVVTLNHQVDFDEASEIALEYDIIAEREEYIDVLEELLTEGEEDTKRLVTRPPVVCVMGHVDHGKTSLLDAIRNTSVIDKEAGGITQHIGAYMVESQGHKITFLDTPGHEAFTAMRLRGAMSTDIAILVVAADDGVMPQTVEAINHAKAAEVEIIVAINKIDKPSANIERVKQELVEYQLVAEDWGGDTIFVPVSAKKGEGIDSLLEMIALVAEVKELKANPKRKARGLVIEAELDKGRGPVATILVQKGTLKVGDPICAGQASGKIRAMIDDKGRRVKEAGPSMPVEILGLNEVPNAGEIFIATESDKEAKTIASAFLAKNRERLIEDTKSTRISLDDLFDQIQSGNVKDLNIVVKADVQGSVEAVKQSLVKLSNDEVAVRVIHGGVGAINESDVTLAATSNAIIIGFNVRPDNTAKARAELESVDLRLYKVIYNAIEDIRTAMHGMLEPIYEEKVIGHAEIRQLYKVSNVGTIAGSYVLDGKFIRNAKVRIHRDKECIYEGELASLKRFKDDVKEVASNYECGLMFDKFNDLQEGDIVETYIMEEVPRK